MIKYDSYKPSGIEWLSEIPSHWEMKRIKDIFSLERGKFSHRPRNDERMYVDGIFPFIQTGDVAKANKYITKYKQVLNQNGIKVSKEFKKGTLLMTIAANIGDVSILGYDAYLPDSLVAFITKYDIDYYYYLFSISKKELDFVKITNTQDNLNLEKLNSIFKCFPPLEEQTQIANYLDTKTQAIDKKINLLTQKANYYKEYRKSIINETVCKGLDKSVQLKDSGIDWIGQIPEHWEVKRFKAIAKTLKGKNLEFADNYFENSLPNLSLDYLRNDTVTFNNFCYSTDKTLLADEDDFVIIWDGAGVGEILRAKKGYISSTIAKLIFNKNFSSKYFFHLRDNLEYTLKQIPTGMGIPHLNPHILNNYQCPFPPLKEQTEIAKYLDAKTQTIDKIISNINTQMAKLKELRKTLINDAVTGKIKVS